MKSNLFAPKLKKTISKTKNPESKPWTEEELERLKILILKEGRVWRKIAPQFGRSPSEVASAAKQYKFGPKIKKVYWSESENAKLTELHEKSANNWKQIAEDLGNRTADACMQQWSRLKRTR